MRVMSALIAALMSLTARPMNCSSLASSIGLVVDIERPSIRFEMCLRRSNHVTYMPVWLYIGRWPGPSSPSPTAGRCSSCCSSGPTPWASSSSGSGSASPRPPSTCGCCARPAWSMCAPRPSAASTSSIRHRWPSSMRGWRRIASSGSAASTRWNGTSTRWRTDAMPATYADGALRFERRFAHPVEKVWRAVSEPAELAHWFPCRVEAGELRVGAKLHFVFPEEVGIEMDGEVTAFEPPRLLAFTWGEDELRFELEPHGDGGTLLRFTDVIAEQDKAARDAAGWDV